MLHEKIEQLQSNESMQRDSVGFKAKLHYYDIRINSFNPYQSWVDGATYGSNWWSKRNSFRAISTAFDRMNSMWFFTAVRFILYES